MLIRHATNNDLEKILEIYNHVILNTTSVYQYKPQTLEMRKAWFDEKMQLGFPVFVAEDQDNNILGFSSLGPFRHWPAYKYTAENSVYVAESSRGKGVGKLLMSPLIDAAIHLQLHTIVAGIDAANLVSIQFHKNFGFIQVAHFKEVGYKFSRWLDLIFLQLILHTPEMPTED